VIVDRTILAELAMTIETKRRSQRLGRRKDTLLKKAYELAKFSEVDVSLTLRIRKTGGIITFNSLDLKSWPPSKDEIVSDYCSVQRFHLNRATTSNLPIRYL
jgi:hypothetical protein